MTDTPSRSAARAVFFDAGGTLIHASPSVGDIYAETTATLGYRLPARRFQEVLDPLCADYRARADRGEVPLPTTDEADIAMWRLVAAGLHRRLPEIAGIDFERWFADVYKAFSSGDNWRVYPEVEETLRKLRERGVSIGIVSNWSSRLRQILCDLQLSARIDVTVISAVIGHRKPDPRIFAPALDACAVAPHEAIHVGDTYGEDVVGAEAAGIRGLLVARNHNGPSPRPEITIESLLGVIDHLG